MTCNCTCHTFTVRGHPNVKATHKTTLEVTADEHLTPRGDCIIAVGAPHGTKGLPQPLKDALKHGWRACLTICTPTICDTVCGWGSPDLQLSDPARIIIRKSTYIEPATLLVKAQKSARDLDRSLIQQLRQAVQARVTICAFPP